MLVVCLAGAPASVVVEADAGVTVSVAEAASVLCFWSVEAVALFTTLLLLKYFLFKRAFSYKGLSIFM